MNKLQLTEDGSHTIYSERFSEHYHSIHGAVQESKHVFIEAGLRRCTKKSINILEIGFGTGLNALLSYLESGVDKLSIRYTTIELYPLVPSETEKLNYSEILDSQSVFDQMHAAYWEEWHSIDKNFSLLKLKLDLTLFSLKGKFDLIYFDAFSPEVQPELWEDAVFENMAAHCNPKAVLTTYSAKGAVRRSLQRAGFHVERIPGPPGKREMLRATYA